MDATTVSLNTPAVTEAANEAEAVPATVGDSLHRTGNSVQQLEKRRSDAATGSHDGSAQAVNDPNGGDAANDGDDGDDKRTKKGRRRRRRSSTSCSCRAGNNGEDAQDAGEARAETDGRLTHQKKRRDKLRERRKARQAIATTQGGEETLTDSNANQEDEVGVDNINHAETRNKAGGRGSSAARLTELGELQQRGGSRSSDRPPNTATAAAAPPPTCAPSTKVGRAAQHRIATEASDKSDPFALSAHEESARFALARDAAEAEENANELKSKKKKNKKKNKQQKKSGPENGSQEPEEAPEEAAEPHAEHQYAPRTPRAVVAEAQAALPDNNDNGDEGAEGRRGEGPQLRPRDDRVEMVGNEEEQSEGASEENLDTPQPPDVQQDAPLTSAPTANDTRRKRRRPPGLRQRDPTEWEVQRKLRYGMYVYDATNLLTHRRRLFGGEVIAMKAFRTKMCTVWRQTGQCHLPLCPFYHKKRQRRPYEANARFAAISVAAAVAEGVQYRGPLDHIARVLLEEGIAVYRSDAHKNLIGAAAAAATTALVDEAAEAGVQKPSLRNVQRHFRVYKCPRGEQCPYPCCLHCHRRARLQRQRCVEQNVKDLSAYEERRRRSGAPPYGDGQADIVGYFCEVFVKEKYVWECPNEESGGKQPMRRELFRRGAEAVEERRRAEALEDEGDEEQHFNNILRMFARMRREILEEEEEEEELGLPPNEEA